MLVICSLSCSKEKAESPQFQTLDEKSEKIMLNDKVFQDYLHSSENFLKNKFDLQKLKELMKLADLSPQNKLEFANAMGFNSTLEFENYAKVQAQRLGYLRKIYNINNYNQADLNKLLVKEINEHNNIENLGPLTLDSKKVSVASIGDEGEPIDPECGRKLASCLAIATATAILGHVACAATDWVTVGVSAYFCHGAVITMQVAMSDSCNLDYKECWKNRKAE